ncbi:MAG: Ig-like domain-containing protein [Gorillibacterium sp.]|nr:Ig-like domain-containing protein [Gorillibacterium sp.]
MTRMGKRLLLLLLAFCFVLPACSQTETQPKASPAIPLAPSEQANTVKSINPQNWIRTTLPADGAENVDSSLKTISITFNQEMNAKSLNPQTITVIEGKHNQLLQDMYLFHYDASLTTLTLTFKDPDSSYGSSNGIDITVSKNVENSQGSKMSADASFGFSVK